MGLLAAVGLAADGPFRSPRVAGDGRVSAGGSGDAVGAAHVARHGATDAERLHGRPRPGPVDVRPAVGPARTSTRAPGRCATVLGGFAGACNGGQRRRVRRIAPAAGAGRVGSARGDLCNGARRVCRPSGRQHPLQPVRGDPRVRPGARADAWRRHCARFRMARDLHDPRRRRMSGVLPRVVALARNPAAGRRQAAAIRRIDPAQSFFPRLFARFRHVHGRFFRVLFDCAACAGRTGRLFPHRIQRGVCHRRDRDDRCRALCAMVRVELGGRAVSCAAPVS